MIRYHRLVQADKDLDNWDPATERDYAHLTGRTQPVRKSIQRFVSVPWPKFVTYIKNFTEQVPRSSNRLNDAKAYRKQNTLDCMRLYNYEVGSLGLRAFNIVIFEEKI